MELVFRISLFITGIINLLPSILAFLPGKISDSYGIKIPDANYELLLRHRAILFMIVGGLLLYSAISKNYYNLAVIVGMVSMLSYVVLYLSIGKEINPELTKVMKIDVAAIGILAVGYLLYKFA